MNPTTLYEDQYPTYFSQYEYFLKYLYDAKVCCFVAGSLKRRPTCMLAPVPYVYPRNNSSLVIQKLFMYFKIDFKESNHKIVFTNSVETVSIFLRSQLFCSGSTLFSKRDI